MQTVIHMIQSRGHHVFWNGSGGESGTGGGSSKGCRRSVRILSSRVEVNMSSGSEVAVALEVALVDSKGCRRTVKS
jgi:hypothetical protein